MTRVYLACPSTDYRSTDLMRAVVACQKKWPNAEIFVPDPVRQIFLGNRQGIEQFVYLTWHEGQITFGVGRELKLAASREIGLWMYNRSTESLTQVSKVPRGILSRQETAELERAYIEAS